MILPGYNVFIKHLPILMHTCDNSYHVKSDFSSDVGNHSQTVDFLHYSQKKHTTVRRLSQRQRLATESQAALAFLEEMEDLLLKAL